MLFKRFQCAETGKVLPYRKVLSDFPVNQLMSSGQWAEEGLNLLDNSPEEIREAALEMHERLDSRWEDRPNDIKLRERYWDMFAPPRHHAESLQVATTFLRRHPELFE